MRSYLWSKIVTPLKGLELSRIGNWLILLSEKMVFSIIKLTKGKGERENKGKGEKIIEWRRVGVW